MYVSCCFPIYLDIYDMWGAIKFLVPEFGLTALLLTSGLSRSSLTSGNKRLYSTPCAVTFLFRPHIVFFFLSLPLLMSLSSTFVAMATVPSFLRVERNDILTQDPLCRAPV